MASPDYNQLVAEVERYAQTAPSVEHLMSEIVARLSHIPNFNWVGFYMISASDESMLEIGPYIGAETPHRRIPLNQGICGAAASSGHTIVVDDVNAEPRYLACSLETRSEVVAPVFAHGRVIGELDIDSHVPAAFAPTERVLVERCAAAVGRYLEQQS
jgi:L-methionine (R)-S-oxide reductase